MINALSQAQIAALFSVAPRTVREWHEKGLPRRPNGTYDGPECVAWYVNYVTGDDLDLNRERARLAAAQATKTELAIAESRAELLPRSRVLADVGEYINACRKRLTNLPSTIGQHLDPDTARRVEPIIRERIHEAVAELRQYRPSMAGRDSGTVDAAADPDRQPVGGRAPPAAARKRGRARTVAHR